MTHLDPKVMSIFTKDVCSSGEEATMKSGIDKLIPDMVIDDFLFQPCGYSMNGVSRSVSRNPFARDPINYRAINITFNSPLPPSG